MTLRKYTRAAGIGAFVFSSWASALGLGEIKLNSALDEPFDAEIQLLNLGDLSEQEILAGLAPPQDFTRAGVDREFILTGLTFGIDLAAPGGPVIRVTSRDPIREPYLDFLVEVQWTSGRLLREYTVLLDLPVFTGEPAGGKPVAAAQVSGPEPASTSATAPPATAASRPVGTGRGTEFKPGDQYKVKSGDTLWKIARNIPSNNTSIQQRMKAVHNLNPDAFINDDINLLRRGHVLRLPAYEDINAVSHRDAVADISRQSASPADSAAQLSASQREKQAPAADTAPEGRLQLSAADDSFQSAGESSGSGTGENLSGSGSLQNDIALVQEELDRTQRENSDLKKRLSNLEDQLSTMQRMLELRSDEFRATQLAVNNSGADPENDAVAALQPAALAESEAGKSEPLAGGNTEPGTDSKNADSDLQANTPVVGPEVTKAPVSQPAAVKSEGILAVVTEYLYYILGGVLALLALLVAKVVRGKKAEEYPADDEILADIARQAEEEPDLFEEEQLETSEIGEEIDLDEGDNLFDTTVAHGHPDLELSDEEEVDPAGEAEIYLSLGNYDEARDVLLEAIEKDPNNPELHLKLLEVYAAGDDGAAFARHLPILTAFNIGALTSRAEELRMGLSGDVVDSDLESETDLESEDIASDGDFDEEAQDIDELFASLESESGVSGEDDDTDDTEAELAEFDLDELEDLKKETDVEPRAGAGDQLANEEEGDFDVEESEIESITDLDRDDGPTGEEDIVEADAADERLVEGDFSEEEALDEFDLEAGASEESLEEASSIEEAGVAKAASEDSDLDFALDLDLDDLDFAGEDTATGDDETTSADLQAQLEEQDLISDLDEFEDVQDSEPRPDSAVAGVDSREKSSEPEESDLVVAEEELDLNDEFDMLGDTDETETQLQLAQAFIDMGDPAGAKDILAEVAETGSDDQKDKAKELLEALS